MASLRQGGGGGSNASGGGPGGSSSASGMTSSNSTYISVGSSNSSTPSSSGSTSSPFSSSSTSSPSPFYSILSQRPRWSWVLIAGLLVFLSLALFLCQHPQSFSPSYFSSSSSSSSSSHWTKAGRNQLPEEQARAKLGVHPLLHNVAVLGEPFTNRCPPFSFIPFFPNNYTSDAWTWQPAYWEKRRGDPRLFSFVEERYRRTQYFSADGPGNFWSFTAIKAMLGDRYATMPSTLWQSLEFMLTRSMLTWDENRLLDKNGPRVILGEMGALLTIEEQALLPIAVDDQELLHKAVKALMDRYWWRRCHLRDPETGCPVVNATSCESIILSSLKYKSPMYNGAPFDVFFTTIYQFVDTHYGSQMVIFEPEITPENPTKQVRSLDLQVWNGGGGPRDRGEFITPGYRDAEEVVGLIHTQTRRNETDKRFPKFFDMPFGMFKITFNDPLTRRERPAVLVVDGFRKLLNNFSQCMEYNKEDQFVYHCITDPHWPSYDLHAPFPELSSERARVIGFLLGCTVPNIGTPLCEIPDFLWEKYRFYSSFNETWHTHWQPTLLPRLNFDDQTVTAHTYHDPTGKRREGFNPTILRSKWTWL